MAALPPYHATTAPVTAAQLGPSWHAGCPVGPAQLRRLFVSYVGCTTPEATISGQTKTGYVATRFSETGNTFTNTREAGGVIRHCDVPPGNDRGGCGPGDSW